MAWVDGQRAPIFRVSPDFGAIALLPGHHEVEVRYQPGPLKPLLFLAGIALFILAARRPLSQAWDGAEERLQKELAVWGERLATERVKIAIALAVLILLFTRALFQGQLIGGHDAARYLPGLAQFAKEASEHQLAPIWAPDLSNGHGQPLFEFAPPLVYLIALPFYRCGMGLADSLQLGLALLFAMGAIAIYLIGRRLSFAPIVSIGAAAAWLFAPYQALDLYVWARMAESAAIATAPVALFGLITVLNCPTMIRVAIGAFAVALVPLANTGVALLLFPVFAAIVVVRCALSRRPLTTAAAGFGAVAGGLGLSACFWLPALLEKDFVKTELLRTGALNWSAHIISPIQLIWGRWGFDYSVPGHGISFSLGLVQIALAIAGVVIAVRGINRTRRYDALTFAAAVIIAALLATQWSSPLWARLATLQYIEYPWRTLSVCALFMPLLALYAFDRMSPRATIAVMALMVVVNLHHTQPRSYLSYDEEFYSPASVAQHGLKAAAQDEYEPQWVQARVRYTGDGILTPTPLTAVRVLSWTSTRHEYSVTTPGLVGVMDSADYYPGWTVLIDGHENRGDAGAKVRHDLVPGPSRRSHDRC